MTSTMTHDAPPADPFRATPPSMLRRCAHCSAVAVEQDGRHVCADPQCGAPARHAPPRCPRCLGMARVDDEYLTCMAGCEPVTLPGSPRAGWEAALRMSLSADYEALWGDPWGLGGMHTVAWDRYSEPGSRLQARWGSPDDDGNEVRSVEGAALVRQHLDDTQRIAEMSAALRALGVAVRADPGIRLRGGNREATSFDACLGASYAVEARPLDDATGQATRAAMAALWGDEVTRSAMVREVGIAACIEVHRCIVMRGGAFGGVGDLLRQLAGVRETPFGGYRHAVAFAFGDHGTTTLGWGNALAGLIGADLPHPLPGGMRFDEIAVSPSRNSGGEARNARTWTMAQDVAACMAAARVGGIWAPPAEGTVGAAGDAWTCDGGRPLTPWEVRLVELCDFGVDVAMRDKAGRKRRPKGATAANAAAAGDDWRRLTVTEAVERVRQEASARAQDGTLLREWGPARHITTPEGKAALKGARRAIADALAAWGLVPRRDRPPRRRSQDDPPRNREPVPHWQRAANAWDVEAPR